ncbi:transposase [Enterococcus avium]|uniref:transposase n=1 Tax=Enterococcus avium TaxID=33945 RepID=UPI003399E952
MTSLHKNQVKFNSNITISHTGGRLSSDSGLVLVKELMNTFGFSHLAKQWLHITDHRAYFTHDNLAILEQLIMQLIAGYSADSSANRLIGAVLMDLHDEWIYSSRKYINFDK